MRNVKLHSHKAVLKACDHHAAGEEKNSKATPDRASKKEQKKKADRKAKEVKSKLPCKWKASCSLHKGKHWCYTTQKCTDSKFSNHYRYVIERTERAPPTVEGEEPVPGGGSRVGWDTWCALVAN